MGLFSDLLSKAGDVKLNDPAKDLNKAVKDLGKAVNEAAEKAGIDLKEVTEKAKAAEADRASKEGTFEVHSAAEEGGPSSSLRALRRGRGRGPPISAGRRIPAACHCG